MAEVPCCPVCGGPGVLLGRLGERVWWRCRACGIDFCRRPESGVPPEGGSESDGMEAGRVEEQVLRTNTCPKCGGSLFVREEVHRFLTYGLGHDGVIEGTPGSVKRVDDDDTLTLWCVDCRAVLGYGSLNREGRFEGVLLEEPEVGSAEGWRS